MQRIEASISVNRPISDVFDWYARNHIQNHPRWDPDIKLEQTAKEPIEVGTIIKRVNLRYGQPVEGAMKVVEFEPDSAIGFVISENNIDMPGRAEFRINSPEQTQVTISTEVPESFPRDLITEKMQRSVKNIKELIESDLQ